MTRTPPHSPPFPTTPPLRTDNGGTANGGVDLDQSANTFTINVTSVNDAPAGTDNAKTINEDGTYTFAAADFGFRSANDTPELQSPCNTVFRLLIAQQKHRLA